MKKKPIPILIILLIFIFDCVLISIVRNQPSKGDFVDDNYFLLDEGSIPLVSAHRAGSLVAPENTMMAFEQCIAREDFDVDVFEFDLHITSDGELILLHDDELDRTSNAVEVFGHKKVLASECTYEELSRLNMGYNFEDEDGNYPFRDFEVVPDNLRVVKLGTVLDYLESVGDFDYIIEIKNGDDLGRLAADKLYAELSARGIVDKVAFGTFQGEISEYVDEKYPDLTRSAGIVEVLQFYWYYIYNVDLSKHDIGYEVLQIPFRLVILNLGKKSLIDYAHSYGIAVQYWTINDPDDIEYLASIGADCIISDSPDVAYKLLYGEEN